MSTRPPSLIAERAVRYLHAIGKPTSSVRLARELLALTVADEHQAKQVLDAAFADDPRLTYEAGAWRRALRIPPAEPEPDVTFVLVEGAKEAARARFRMSCVVALRRRGDAVVAACGGVLASAAPGSDLKVELRSLLEGARIVLCAPPGGLAAVEQWIGEPLVDPLPLVLLARRRLSRPDIRDAEGIAAALGLSVRVDDDPAHRVDLLPVVFDALRPAGESWGETFEACRPGGAGIPWPRYAFTEDDLRAVPPTPGTYRFFDLDGKLLYVGKSRNLKRRLAAWFGEHAQHGARSRAIIEAVHRFEMKPSGSELTALLREASQIRRDQPAANVQRRVHPRRRARSRLGSILILEPAESPWVLRAWLIRDGRLLDSVPLGRRGGGLRRIERMLRDEFFDPRSGPRSGGERAVDVEIVARWLTENRDKAVAFDPTHFKTVDEVVFRLRWFLERGSVLDPEGSPILPR